MGYQQITILGNLTRDAEVRQVGQSQVAKTSVAVTEKFRKADGTFGESTEYFDVEIWDKAGIYPYLKKGSSVLVLGQIKTDKWQDQQGQNHESKKVRVQVIQLAGNKTQQQQAAPVQGYAPQPGFQAPQYAPAPAPQAPQYAPAPAPAPQPVPQYQPQPQPAPLFPQSQEGPDLPF